MSNFVDADAHVDECEETWEYLPSAFKNDAPRTMYFKDGDSPAQMRWNVPEGKDTPPDRFWFIDGQLYKRILRDDDRTRTTRQTRELHDPAARVKHMDELGIETQILYPSLFLADVTRRPELNAALYHSYNRWLADRCADSGGRLRWAALIPFSSPEAAKKELVFAKENGAAAFFKRTVESGKSIGDPVFHPLYEQAAELNLPICIHQNREWLPIGIYLSSAWSGDQETSRFPILTAFQSLIAAKIPEKIPGLRWGFIEAGASWLPFLLYQTGYDHKSREFGVGKTLADYRFWVTCEVGEDLAYLISAVGGDDNLIVGTDYTHADKSALMDAHKLILDKSDIDQKSARKITSDNARVLYGL